MGLPALATLFDADDGVENIRTEFDWVEAVRSGLPVSAIDTVTEKLGFSPAELEQFVLPRRTLAHRRAKRQPLTLDESVRLARLARVAVEAQETFGDATNAQKWLRRPNRALNGNTPLALLDTEDGARLVETVLGRLAHGLFS